MTGLLRAFSPRNDKGGSHCELVFPPGEAISLSVPKAGHCEFVVPFAKQSQLRDCFGPLALAMTNKKGHCEPRFFAPHLSLRASLFRLAKQSQRFLAALRLGMTGQKSHCEVVVSFPKQSQKLLSRGRIASLRSQQRRKRPSDCFGPLALAMTNKKGHCEPRFFRLAKQSEIASLRSQRRKMPPDCFASLATAKNAAGLLRRFRSSQ